MSKEIKEGTMTVSHQIEILIETKLFKNQMEIRDLKRTSN